MHDPRTILGANYQLGVGIRELHEIALRGVAYGTNYVLVPIRLSSDMKNEPTRSIALKRSD